MIAAILIALWPLTFFVLTPKWDNVDAFLPYRYFLSDYLWNGYFPFWNSFQLMGYPAYADPQSGMWNPLTWIIMLFGKYTMKSLIFEVLFYFVLAGAGMFTLTKALVNHKGIGAIIGLCYALSGLFVGSAQLMVFLAGTAYLPWCLYALYNYSKYLSLKYLVLAALFFALNTVSASPAFTIVLFYIYVAWFVYLFLKNIKLRNQLRKIVLQGFILIGVILILLLPYIASLIEFSPYFQRVSKLPYYGGHLLNNPFTLVSYISFILPYGVISNSEVFNITDSTLRNAYFGILTLFFFFYTVISFYKKKKVIIGFLGVVFFLIVAAGGETFVYRILYFLPGFGTFSHPSFFRSYAVVIMLLMAGYGMKVFTQKNQFNYLKRKKNVFVLSISLLLVGIGLYLNSREEINAAFQQLMNLTEFSALSFSTHIIFNLLLLIAIIIIVLQLKHWLKLSFITTVFLFAFLDLGIQTMLTFPRTISYHIKYDGFKTFFNKIPNDIHQPEVDTALKKYDDNNGLIAVGGIWHNRSTFNKTISYNGYNPFKIKYFETARKDSSLFFNIENPLFFFPKSIKTDTSSLRKGLIWGVENFEHVQESENQILSINVGYNQFKASVVNNSKNSRWLLLNQNYYPKWKAFINDTEVKVYKVNTHIMGVEVPPNGTYTVLFKYKASYMVYLAILNIIAFIWVFIYCIKVFLPAKKELINEEN
ncbi:hypothetical protein CW751_01705 [Brumimicrobium salinarum]|uniref:YfhO family protein n=2 Tax=Brumimicrobium salinarum TaxID=2058658 RepID=A0A2I0R664_9FLAO|nr:hypothetical protein CW751_01705 [Brumimicrobium salinarum]